MKGWFEKLALEEPALYGEPAPGVRIHILLRFWPYLSHFKSEYDCVESKVGLLNLSSHLVWSYLSHIKSEFDDVKNKLRLLSNFNIPRYLAIYQLVCQKSYG